MGKEQERRLYLKIQELLERNAKIGTDIYFENYSHAKKILQTDGAMC